MADIRLRGDDMGVLYACGWPEDAAADRESGGRQRGHFQNPFWSRPLGVRLGVQWCRQ